jgi:hypothetical protein
MFDAVLLRTDLGDRHDSDVIGPSRGKVHRTNQGQSEVTWGHVMFLSGNQCRSASSGIEDTEEH